MNECVNVAVEGVVLLWNNVKRWWRADVFPGVENGGWPPREEFEMVCRRVESDVEHVNNAIVRPALLSQQLGETENE